MVISIVPSFHYGQNKVIEMGVGDRATENEGHGNMFLKEGAELTISLSGGWLACFPSFLSLTALLRYNFHTINLGSFL